MGSLYKRGMTYWIKYYRGGKPFRESAHSEKESDARRLLKLREGQIAEGRFPGLRVERVRFEDLARDFLNDYQASGRKSLRRAKGTCSHLRAWFQGMRAVDITTDRIRAYIVHRQAEGATHATINRELAALKRMFSLGMQQTPPKVLRRPYIPMLKENNTRSGFFTQEDYLALRGALPDSLKPVVTLAYHTGFRREEMLSLRWDQVDLSQRRIVLEVGTTKNHEGRVVYMTEDLFRMLEAQKRLRDWQAPSCPLVCFRMVNGHALPIKDFRSAWDQACKMVGLEGRLLHDFRRTAVRNMVRAGIPERVAMRISGHKTRSVFDRYNITSEADLLEAAGKLDAFHGVGHNLGTIAGLEAALEESGELQPLESIGARGENRTPKDRRSGGF